MESLLLACAGGVAGILMAQLTSAGLRAALLPDGAGFSLWRDERTLLFASGSVLAVSVLAGLASVMQAMRTEFARDIKAGIQHAHAYRRTDLRAALVVLQVALSVLLLVGAGLFVRSLQHVRAVRLGYDVDPVLIVQLNRRGARLEEAQQVELRNRLVVAAKSLPSVENASLANGIPFYNSWREGLFLPGASKELAGEFELSAVSPSYFATMQTRIVRRRGLEELDGPNAPLVAVVGESMAAALWPGKNPIGQCIGIGARADSCTRVVGVAEDIKAHALDWEAVMHYYLPAAQFHPEFTQLLVRVRGDASRDAEAVRRALQREMPGASYLTVSRFSDVIGGETRSWRLGATVFTAFGFLALVLAALGLYSVIMYNVAQRTHELAIRTALGAKGSDLVRLVVLDGVRLGLAGVLIGGVLALVAGHWVEPLLFQESSRDASVFALVIGVLVAVAFAASWLPANRASRAEPLSALRYE
jgi:predicted permease